MSSSPVRVLFAGDVNGNLDALFAKVGKVNGTNGPFNALFCVGSFFEPQGSDDEAYMGQLEPYINGNKVAPVATYFIGGYGRGSAFALQKLTAKPSSKINYLGRSGISTVEGLKVAFLDGCYNSIAYTSEETSSLYYTQDTVEALKSSIMHMKGDLDVLLSNEWPEGVMNGVKATPEIKSLPSSGPLSEIALIARPRYHVAGANNVSFSRVPYINADKGTGKHVTRFIALGHVGNSTKQKWVQALALIPCDQMDQEQFKTIPPESTQCPFSMVNPAKRSHDEASLGEQTWRWQDGAKRSKMPAAAPSLGRQDVVKDRSKTIFVRNVPFSATEEELVNYFSSCGTIVDIVRKANQDGKLNTYCHIQFSTQEEMHKACQLNEQVLMGRKLFIEPASSQVRKKDAAPVEGCWFCLSNPNADVNLVCSVGQECYIAIDKGAINENHILIVPIEHHACSVDLPVSTMEEIGRYMSALSSYYASRGQMMVGFERFMRLRKSGGNHCHVNLIGISLKNEEEAEEAFVSAGKKLGHSFTLLKPGDTLTLQESLREEVGEGEYFCAILPDGSRLVHPIAYGERHPLSFGREVLASLAGAPERSDWKVCSVSQQEEMQRTELFKSRFKPYDIMFE